MQSCKLIIGEVFTITEKAPTRAWLNVNVKLGHHWDCKGHKGWVGCLAQILKAARDFEIFADGSFAALVLCITILP